MTITRVPTKGPGLLPLWELTLPLACLMLMVPGQPGGYDTIKSPAVLISYGEKALLAGDLYEIDKLIRPMEIMLAETTDENQKNFYKREEFRCNLYILYSKIMEGRVYGYHGYQC